jgi:hypothetical protein
MPSEVKFSFNREGKYSRHYALTRIAMFDGYNMVVNDHLCPECKYDQLKSYLSEVTEKPQAWTVLIDEEEDESK